MDLEQEAGISSRLRSQRSLLRARAVARRVWSAEGSGGASASGGASGLIKLRFWKRSPTFAQRSLLVAAAQLAGALAVFGLFPTPERFCRPGRQTGEGGGVDLFPFEKPTHPVRHFPADLTGRRRVGDALGFVSFVV